MAAANAFPLKMFKFVCLKIKNLPSPVCFHAKFLISSVVILLLPETLMAVMRKTDEKQKNQIKPIKIIIKIKMHSFKRRLHSDLKNLPGETGKTAVFLFPRKKGLEYFFPL